MQWMLLLLLGVNFVLWLAVGAARLAAEPRPPRESSAGADERRPTLSPADVAVLIPAHNEETGIGATVESVRRLVPAGNIHVAADGCGDRTAAIARAHGADVLELDPGRGKAGGIQAALHHFDLARRFAVLLIVDADTELDEHYIERGLRLLDDRDMVALAGYAHTKWHPEELPLVGRFLVAYRTRLYAVMQWMKYGQTWRHTNVAPIVPGFASMYRTATLPHMDLNPPGLVIEDFNMTFELHHKRLGKIAFVPSAFGKTQDPDNLPDYCRQINRWWLGLWQTLRRHKFWPSWFSATLALFLLEVVLASVVLLLIALAILLLALPALPPLSGGRILQWEWYVAFHQAMLPFLSPRNLLLFLFLPDYLLTCCVALWARRPSLLLYGIGFLPIRLIDAVVALWTLPKAWWTRSTGQWTSPRRRAAEPAPPAPVASLPEPAAEPAAEPAGENPAVSAEDAAPGPGREPATRPPTARRVARLLVLRDAVLMGALLALAAGAIALGAPVFPLAAAAILSVALATVAARTSS